jgi:Flp pilus assembly protein TadB
MPANDDQSRIPGNSPGIRASGSGFLGKILTTLASVAVLVMAFMLSLLVFAFVAAIGLMLGGYLWWKTRELRKQMRERPQGGRIIEGEVVRDSAAPDPTQPRSLH